MVSDRYRIDTPSVTLSNRKGRLLPLLQHSINCTLLLPSQQANTAITVRFSIPFVTFTCPADGLKDGERSPSKLLAQYLQLHTTGTVNLPISITMFLQGGERGKLHLELFLFLSLYLPALFTRQVMPCQTPGVIIIQPLLHIS